MGHAIPAPASPVPTSTQGAPVHPSAQQLSDHYSFLLDWHEAMVQQEERTRQTRMQLVGEARALVELAMETMGGFAAGSWKGKGVDCG